MDRSKDAASRSNDGLSSSPAPSAPKRQAAADTADNGNVGTKRRRRVFSCESCQRLKCRCDYDGTSKSCRRCQTLRIACSKKDDSQEPALATGTEHSASIEDRLRANEEAVTEIKTLVQTLSQEIHQMHTRQSADTVVQNYGVASPTSARGSREEHGSNPADHAVHSAPVVILREIGRRSAGVSKQLPPPASTGIDAMGLFEGVTSDEIRDIVAQTSFLVGEKRDLAVMDELRVKSPFLYDVCCLRALSYRSGLAGTPLHRKIYEGVRASLGKVLLSNASTLHDMQGILLMNENLNTPIGDGIEYIDGWMLTGYAAQKAMLNISFYEIVSNIKNGEPTAEDTKAVRLWSTICLHHLHWAATTGRPSTIPNSYVKHCNILLSFYDATLEDSMILAEIALYQQLLHKLDERPTSNSDGKEFAEWKQEWNHLLSLPTASMLKIGHSSACLILATKRLEDLGEGLRSAAFLPTHPLRTAPTPSRNHQHTNTKTAFHNLRTRTLAHASTILETFLQIPDPLKNAIESNKCLCLGYGALILAHYGGDAPPAAARSEGRAEEEEEEEEKEEYQRRLQLVTRVEAWFANAHGKLAVAKYARMARQRLVARMSDGVGEAAYDLAADDETVAKEGRADDALPEDANGAVGGAEGNGVAAGDAAAFWCGVAPAAGYEGHGDAAFPNMEEFFSGGFLGFGFEE